MSIIIHGINIDPLLKAQKRFEAFRQNLKDDQDKAGAIQAFEYTFELAWKTMKRLLNVKGIDVRSPRDCFREAALNNLIKDPKIWFGFIEMRNLTVHTYDEIIVERVLTCFSDFSSELQILIENIQHAT